MVKATLLRHAEHLSIQCEFLGERPILNSISYRGAMKKLWCTIVQLKEVGIICTIS